MKKNNIKNPKKQDKLPQKAGSQGFIGNCDNQATRRLQGIYLPNAILQMSGLSSKEKVLVSLIAHLSQTRTCSASNAYLADKLHCSPDSIQYSLNHLAAKGILKRCFTQNHRSLHLSPSFETSSSKGIWLPNPILMNRKLNWGEKIHLAVLVSFANFNAQNTPQDHIVFSMIEYFGQRVVYASTSYLANFVGFSKNAVQKCHQSLQNKGYLEIARYGNGRNWRVLLPNEAILHQDKIELQATLAVQTNQAHLARQIIHQTRQTTTPITDQDTQDNTSPPPNFSTPPTELFYPMRKYERTTLTSLIEIKINFYVAKLKKLRQNLILVNRCDC